MTFYPLSDIIGIGYERMDLSIGLHVPRLKSFPKNRHPHFFKTEKCLLPKILFMCIPHITHGCMNVRYVAGPLRDSYTLRHTMTGTQNEIKFIKFKRLNS